MCCLLRTPVDHEGMRLRPFTEASFPACGSDYLSSVQVCYRPMIHCECKRSFPRFLLVSLVNYALKCFLHSMLETIREYYNALPPRH